MFPGKQTLGIKKKKKERKKERNKDENSNHSQENQPRKSMNLRLEAQKEK
jgi:hypothetical protein